MRALLIGAGLELLIEEGLSRGTDQLTFKRVFDRIQAEHGLTVTNASVIGRIWNNMEEYQAAVLTAVLVNDDQQGMDEALEAAGTVLASADRASAAGRVAAASEVCRVAGQAMIDSLLASPKASINIGLRGLAISRLSVDQGTPGSSSVLGAYEEIRARWDYALESAFEVLGLGIRPGLSVRQLSMLVVSLAEGALIWDRIDPACTRQILRPTGLDGEEQEWGLFAVGIEALVWQFTEPIEMPASAALSRTPSVAGRS